MKNVSDLEPEHKFHCEKHGPHSGGKIGRTYSENCPQCVSELRIAKIKASFDKRRDQAKGILFPDEAAPKTEKPFAPSAGAWIETNSSDQSANKELVVVLDFTGCQWLLDWVKSQSVLPVDLYIKRHFAEIMPPEDIRKVILTKII